MIAVLIVLVFGSTATAAPESWNPFLWQDFPSGADGAVTIFDSQGQYAIGSQLFYKGGSRASSCAKIGEGDCTYQNFDHIQGSWMLGKCESATDSPCVESLSITSPEGLKVQGSLVGYTTGTPTEPPQTEIPGDPKLGLPDGHLASVWKFPGVNNSAGNDLYILKYKATWTGSYDAAAAKASVRWVDLQFNLLPFRLSRTVDMQDGGLWRNGYGAAEAAYQVDFQENTRVEVVLRSPTSIATWLNVRGDNLKLEQTKITDQTARLTLEADPVLVPGLKVFTNHFTPPGWSSPLIGSTSFYGRQALELVEKLREQARDTSTGELRVFGFTSFAPTGYSRCITPNSGVIGIVSSSAMAYSDKPPQLVDGFLEYKLSGMHYLSNGAVAHGNFQMVISADVARCIYGFSNAPVSASIQVVNEQGKTEIASTAVKISKDWLQLSASNFSFSTKTMRSTFRTEKNGNSQAANSSVKPKPIICVSGKKKVTLPLSKKQCPKGYKPVK